MWSPNIAYDRYSYCRWHCSPWCNTRSRHHCRTLHSHRYILCDRYNSNTLSPCRPRCTFPRRNPYNSGRLLYTRLLPSAPNVLQSSPMQLYLSHSGAVYPRYNCRQQPLSDCTASPRSIQYRHYGSSQTFAPGSLPEHPPLQYVAPVHCNWPVQLLLFVQPVV